MLTDRIKSHSKLKQIELWAQNDIKMSSNNSQIDGGLWIQLQESTGAAVAGGTIIPVCNEVAKRCFYVNIAQGLESRLLVLSLFLWLQKNRK